MGDKLVLPVLDEWENRDSDLAALLRETIERVQRDRFILGLRKRTQSQRHRMLLALVLNLPNRTAIESALRQIALEGSPEQWLWKTVRSMYVTPDERSPGKSPMGLPLNEADEEVLRLLFDGQTADHLSKGFAAASSPQQGSHAACLT